MSDQSAAGWTKPPASPRCSPQSRATEAKAGDAAVTPPTFEQWISLAFPWLPPHSRDYLNLKAAWEAGHKAAQEAKV